MVVDRSNVDHIMRGLQSTEGVRLHNHRKKLRQRFDIIKKLGQGTYGKVQLGINKETGQEVAIKTIKKCKIETEADLVRIRREIQIMSSVRHPNIIHIYEVFENREKIVLVMEYAAGGELYDYLSERKVLEETEARRIFRQISTAIYYCHKHKICHRDLKLENILLDEHGSAKIADFGLSNVFDGQRLLSTYCGSPLYASPEIVKGTPYHGPEVDCWSLGVLLYTLVYGAMPFDGSNFKRLVKQISQGDYFEPKKASSASPLIRDMLTVNSPDRATIEQICSHWWVNQGFNVSCLDIAEDLANQTPVRLDLLLSLAPPPENTEKIVVTDDQKAVPQEAPPRSMSVGSFMDLDQNAEDRVRSFVAREVPSDNAAASAAANEKAMKRKLETAPSKSFSGARKKERTKPETEEEPVVGETESSANNVESNNAVMEVDSEENKSAEKVKSEETVEPKPVEKESEKTESPEKLEPKKPEEEKPAEAVSKDKPTRKSVKVVKKKVGEKKDSEAEKKEGSESADAKAKLKKKKTESPGRETEAKKETSKEKSEEKETGKEVKRDAATRKSRGSVKQEEKEKTPKPEEGPTKPVERRKSKIFETAEKFMTNEQKSPTQEKPKKVYIPGVKVSDFAKAFERRSSVPATPTLKSSPSRKAVGEKKSEERKTPEKKSKSPEPKKEENSSQAKKTSPPKELPKKEETTKVETKEESPEQKVEEEEEQQHKPTPVNDEKLKKLKDSARNIISNALVEEERKKLKKQILKPPVPRTKTEDLENRRKSLTLQIGKETATVQVHTPENTRFLFDAEGDAPAGENKENIEKPKEKKTAKLEITLKSNTLPRRTSKAEVRLASPQVKKETENFRTEVEHRVGDPSHVFSTQRSEVAFPVSAAQQKPTRSMSLEPESRPRNWQSRERIIPIQVEGGGQKEENEERDRVKELDRPREGRQKLPYQRTWSLRSNSLSRQSTQDSDTESTMSTTGEPIKKSPREFIIPIAVEGGGYVTPRATSLEPSESMSSKRSHRPFSRKFSLFSDNGSEDESPFSTLRDEPFRLHRLRSSRPTRTSAERADSASGSEEEEDDDGFELLTAENLFSTLLSRVRSLTQRLNVEDGLRPGFPSSRLLSNHFGPSERLFSNFSQPLTRLPERSEFARSLSRDLENGSSRWSPSSRSDVRNSESNRSVPRGNSKRSDSDTESMSESSAASTRPRKTTEERRGKKGRSHSRTNSGPVGLGGSEEVTEYVPTFDGNRSLYVPSRMWTAKSYERGESDGMQTTGFRSGIPKLTRPTSLLVEKLQRESEERETKREKSEEPKEKDFYDILAEKYGITNVIRYDLPRDSRTRYMTDNLVENRRSFVNHEVKEESQKKEEKVEKEPPPSSSPSSTPTSKKEEFPGEKFRTPSEKLAAVLNRLEGTRKQEKKEAEKVEKKSENEPLPGLSPAAAELYEKTLAEYRKLKEKRGSEPREQPSKSRLPRKVTGRNLSDMSLPQTESERGGKESKTPERSVLEKYLRHSSVEPQQEVEKPKGEENKKKSESKNPKKKFLTSLERKLERLRTGTEKKYVDKAIRSLRESSLGPKDVASENVLIKRAVSLSDCPSYKNSQPGKIQSTVNSVLGMFKKLENSEKKKTKIEPEKQEKEAKEKEPETEKSKIPILVKPEMKSEAPKSSLRTLEPLVVPTYARRPSYFTGNGFVFHRPCSPLGLDDSLNFLSPDAESFDSWSNCSEVANLDDFLHGKSYGKTMDVSRESVSDRIRRKSFYSRFNERKKPRRSSLLSNYSPEGEGDAGRVSYARSFSGNPSEPRTRPSYYRSVSSGDEARPRPFYKSETSESPTRRKNSFDWSRPASGASYTRAVPQSPFGYSSLTLPRNFSSFSPHRGSSLYGSSLGPEIERPYSPIRPYGSRPVSPSGYPTSQSPNSFE